MIEYDPKIVGNRIREYRLAQNLSQKELSRLANISPSYLGSLENGTLSPNGSGSLNVFIQIANALGVTLDDLAGETLEYKNITKSLEPAIQKIAQEIESMNYNKLSLFRNIVNILIK